VLNESVNKLSKKKSLIRIMKNKLPKKIPNQVSHSNMIFIDTCSGIIKQQIIYNESPEMLNELREIKELLKVIMVKINQPT
jgi:hypothetical protein